MYQALTQYRGKWLAVHTHDSCLHGVLEELTPEYLKIYEVNDQERRTTTFLRTDTIIRFTPDARELQESMLKATYNLDDGDDKEAVQV